MKITTELALKRIRQTIDLAGAWRRDNLGIGPMLREMGKDDEALEHIKAICAALPDAPKEVHIYKEGVKFGDFITDDCLTEDGKAILAAYGKPAPKEEK